VASINKEPFHRISCRWAQKISPKNAVYYNTRQEAIQDGHRPCKVCKP
jgi:nuclease (SNase domain protein)